MNRYRLMVFAGVCLVILLLAVMVTNLLFELRNLSRAAKDNPQWSILQIDTEFANLDANLTENVASQTRSFSEVRLRVDIALSRLDIISSGRSAELFSGSAEAAEQIAPIKDFAEAAVAILDAAGPLTLADLVELQRLVREVRPHVRAVAVLGIRLGAAQSDERRAKFARQLSWTGGIAIVLLLVLTGMMFVLDRLLRRAARRDAALSASTRQLESTLKASLDAIVTADTQGRIVDFNTSAERVFGWARNEIVGQSMDKTIIPVRMRDAHQQGMQRFLKTGVPKVVDADRLEMAALRKSGEEFPVELNITFTQDGDQTTFIAYIRDISARKINEQKLIDARDRAQRTDKAKSQFLSVMSHEMRTPLNGILGVLDLLKTTPLTPQQDRYAKIATSSSEVLLEHVNEALDVTRIETGKLYLAPQDFDLPDVMAGLMDMFGPLTSEKNLTFTLEIEQVMRGRFYGDAGRIRQILTNIIGNAIKFTDHGGVHVYVHGIHGPETSSLRFEVQDTGIGIPADKQERVFEDYFALASSDGRLGRGDGLGLSISRRIARAMDGDVSVRDAKDGGSVFVLTLPLARSKPVATQPVEAPKNTTAPPRARRILIVEDNPINRGVLSDMLNDMGHTVSEAVNGADCLETAQRATFDIIFMDIGMPVLDGIEATRRLRQEGGPNAQTPIIGLTAHGREEFREKALAAGMDRFHTKPIRLEALHRIIAGLTSGPFETAQPVDNQSALREMVDVLGAKKVRAVSKAFLTELDELISALGTTTDRVALAEMAHKVKGAASLLGLSALAQDLGVLQQNAHDGALQDPKSWGSRLTEAATRARSTLADAQVGTEDNPIA